MSGTRTGRRAAAEAAREAQQADRRRLLKRRLPLVAGGVVLLLVVAYLVAGLLQDGDPSSGSASSHDRTQRTVLVQVVPTVGGAAVSNALTASDPSAGSAALLVLPPRLITDVPGAGRTTLDQSTVVADGVGASNAIADQLGLIVDGSWVLTESALAGLVDSVGGVTVDVDADVTAESGESRVVVVGSGPAQQLDGAKAVAFATFTTDDEAEAVRLARLTQVWTALVAALPADASAIEPLLTGHAGSTSSLPLDQLAEHLEATREAALSQSLGYPTLPTVVVDTGSGPVSYRMDAKKAPEVLAVAFAGSLPAVPPGGAVTVLVQNGVGTPGLLEQAREKLIAAGLTYKGGGNATSFGHDTTVVLIDETGQEAVRRGTAVAEALGLPESAVKRSEDGQSVADVLVILGADFQG